MSDKKMLGIRDINFGQEFLPDFPDAYISEDLPRDDGKCPACRHKLLFLKNESRPVCTNCYLHYKELYGEENEELSPTDKEFIHQMMLSRFISENVNEKEASNGTDN